ncbi:MAG: hypothetical protein WCZ90_07225 [Melioribacteraceae bacterium]
MKEIYFKKFFYHIIYITLYVIFFVYLFPKILSSSANVIEAKKYILIVGDFNNEGSFGQNVLDGFQIALNEKGKNKTLFSYETISVDERVVENVSGSINYETKEVHEKLKSELIDRISSKSVLCIISANNSQTLRPCLEIGRTFNIPVLITVATSDIDKEFNDIFCRLPANNKKQATCIINWMNRIGVTPSSYFGVLYSPTIYGTGLLRELQKQVDFEKLIPFTINTTTDMVGTINYGNDIKISGWVSLSYLKEAIEIQLKKEKLIPQKPILFSDGAYGSWIEKVNRKKEELYLSFPETYPDKNKKIDKVNGFGVFGYDAYWIIDNCLNNSIDKRAFNEKLFLFENISSSQLIQKYKFSNGENINSKFKVYKIDEDLP